MIRQLYGGHHGGEGGRSYFNLMTGKHVSEEVIIGEKCEGRRETGW